MSSALYKATCLSRAGATVDIELEPTGAIEPHFSLSDWFGFALVHESASARPRRPGQPRGQFPKELSGALADEVSFDDVIEHSSADSPARRTLMAHYVLRAGYVSTVNWTPSVSAPALDGVYRTGVDPRTSPAIAKARQLSALARAGQIPAAVLRVEMTDPKWVAHLEPQMQWDVYAFDDDAPLLL